MIYRQAHATAADLDARARILDLAARGSHVRASWDRKRRAQEHAARVEQDLRERREQARRNRAHRRKLNRLRRLAVSRWGALRWTQAATFAGIFALSILPLMPLWLLALDTHWLGYLILGGGTLLPFALVELGHWLSSRALEVEHTWMRTRPIRPEGHWEALGEERQTATLSIRFEDSAPNPELMADIVMGLSAQLGRKPAAWLAGTSIREDADKKTLFLVRDGLAPREYRTWSHTVVDDVVATLHEAFPVRSLRIRRDG